jgi:SAM-dependent methyltransferase
LVAKIQFEGVAANVLNICQLATWSPLEKRLIINEVNQDATFLAGEGDAWFIRNRAALSTGKSRTFAPSVQHRLRGLDSVLEIGCADGRNLEQFIDLGFQTVVGVDPSELAVSLGTAQNKKLDLRVGTAENLPVDDDEKFDVVIAGFFLYLVDRSHLLASIANIDRVLRKSGYLLLIDFFSSKLTKIQYVHKPGLFSYKMNYSEIFLATNEYQLIESYVLAIAPLPGNQPYPTPPLSSASKTVAAQKGDPVNLWLLQKTATY